MNLYNGPNFNNGDVQFSIYDIASGHFVYSVLEVQGLD